MTDNAKKGCSHTGPVYVDTISKERIFTGHCRDLGIKGCKPPIKATSTPNGTRGRPLTGSYNNPGFELTRAFRKSHAAKYGKSRTRFIYPSADNTTKECRKTVAAGYIKNILL